MPVKLFITIDVEEDSWGAYHEQNPAVNNVARIPVLQTLFNRFGAIPTYLVNFPVANNAPARKILLEILNKGQCGIGTHCHPWNTPPFDEEINSHNTMLCNLPYETARSKIEAVHKSISDSFGMTPKCFRAGRWGFGPVVARCIHELGYEIDTSITPLTDWTYSKGPNFWEAPSIQYRFDPEDVLSSTRDGCLLEVPATVDFLQENRKLCSHILKLVSWPSVSRLRLKGILDKLGIINHRWLSPELNSAHGMILLADRLIKKGCACLNMSFHSSSLLPGCSPFVRDERESQRFLSDIEQFLEFAKRRRMQFAPLSEAEL